MLVFLANDDIITAKIDSNTPIEGAISVPDQYAATNVVELRVFNDVVKHLSEFDTYFVDEFGVRHVTQADGRKAIGGAWNAPLVKDEDGWRLQSDAERLDKIKTRAKNLVDTKAEQLRAKIVTAGDGQMATYLAQEAEAKMLKADPDTSTSTPYIDALIGIIAPTRAEAVDIILDMSANWNNLNAQINAVRLKTKADIDLVDNEEDVNELVATAPWPDLQA